jgi:hypothetical protein
VLGFNSPLFIQIVKFRGLVLEVGSGSNPWTHSDVLTDLYQVDNDGQRGGGDLSIDKRPLVITPGEKLPFKDNSFEFVYTSHVVEHAYDVASMLNEMSRVGKSGYIECPNPLLEKILDQEQHNWYLYNTGTYLAICRKTSSNNISTKFDHVYFQLLSNSFLVRKFWPLFVTRYEWKESIKYVIYDDIEDFLSIIKFDSLMLESFNANPMPKLVECLADSFKKRFQNILTAMGFKPLIKNLIKNFSRRSHVKGKITFNQLHSILVCPVCSSSAFDVESKNISCLNCSSSFETHPPLVVMADA